MNTYFSQKVLLSEPSETREKTYGLTKMLIRKNIISLAQTFRLDDLDDELHQESSDNQVACASRIRNNCDSKQHPLGRSAVNDSLLEMVESQGAVGWREAQVRVVIQRVYCLPAREGYRSHVQGNKPLGATPIINSDPPNVRAVVKAADIEKTLKKTVASIDHKRDRDSVSLESKWAGTETNCQMANTTKGGPVLTSACLAGGVWSLPQLCSCGPDSARGAGTPPARRRSLRFLSERTGELTAPRRTDISSLVGSRRWKPPGCGRVGRVSRGATWFVSPPRVPRAQCVSAHAVRLCLLVQDAYGMFSEVQLQSLSSAEDIEQYCKRWEGKFCCLAGMRILQRTTRGRALGLFSLIDSLWPPVVPVKVPGQSQDSEMMTTNLPPPSFCYILTVQSGEINVEVDEEEQISNLYQPPAVHGLKEILQIDGCNERCSFWAQVLYLRLQTKHSNPINQREIWLFVTDSTLQNVVHVIPKVVAVSVAASCVLSREITETLSVASQPVFFKDALWGNGRIICVERTVLLLQKPLLYSAAGADLSELTGPLRLDELDSTTQANSICAVR
ncbi:PREDICTED: DNA repair-scaffolding protein, partial [Tauraco erythrolophus]|uniref:DNA repair-scaffolding protein n=1 Tax=Tauraco erythrolophus TaxID=121530 RepID=UPI000523AB46